MNKIYFIIGASGAGKTTAVKNIEKTNPNDFQYCYFDSVGVPSEKDMIEKFGSGENWQKINTNYWVKKMKDEYLAVKPAILDGQTRPSFIEEACKENNIVSYEVILFDCTEEVRKQRLINRGHPELANDQMMNWAKYLREESLAKSYPIIDNTNSTEYESKQALLKILNETKS
jgi:dephospho-CoA kinase